LVEILTVNSHSITALFETSSLIFSIGSLSYSVSSIDLVFCSVIDPYIDYPKSKPYISMTVQAILIVLLHVNALFICKSAARRVVLLFYFFVELQFSKLAVGFCLIFLWFIGYFKGNLISLLASRLAM